MNRIVILDIYFFTTAAMLEIVMNFLLCSFRFGSPAAESARARAGGDALGVVYRQGFGAVDGLGFWVV